MADTLEEVVVTGARRNFGGRSGVNILTTADPYFGGIGDFNFEAATNSALRNTQLTTITIDDVVDAADDGKEAIARGERALADAYTRRILDSFVPDATEAAEGALRAGSTPADVARQLAAREILDGQSFGATRAVEAVNAAIARLDTVTATASRALPEVLGTAGRIVGGVPFAIATGIVEGIYSLGGYLSDLALRNALDRMEPPTAPDEPPRRLPPGTMADPLEFGPESQPEVVVPGRRPPVAEPLTPRMPDLLNPSPLVDPVLFAPPSSSTPSPTTDLDLFTLAPPLPLPSPTTNPAPTTALPSPELWTLAPPLPGWDLSPEPTGPRIPNTPTSTPNRNCDCSPQQKKKRKKKAREVCYRGEYVERRNGLTKYRKRKIACQ